MRHSSGELSQAVVEDANMRLSDEPEQSSAFWRSQEMLLIQNVMAQLSKGLVLDLLLREVLHLLSEMLGLNRGRIVLYDSITKTYRVRHSYGLTNEEVERGKYALGEGITGRVLANGQLIIVQNIHTEPIFLARAVERHRLPAEPVSFIAVPITLGHKTIGVLACHRIRHRNRPLADDAMILRTLSALIGQLLQLNEALQEKTRGLEQHNDLLARALANATVRYGIIGTSPPLLRAIAELEQISTANASVLLLGESGTGKELFARALHLASPRCDRPFINVNCAAIPDTLFESELFGHERGAFTGASDARAGWFEQANTGTIFLDEIGEMPLMMQTKLLRTLQEGTIARLGAKRETKVDVRLVAATNRDLQNEVAQGRFREDLFYRLNVIPIKLPSLADRLSDIPLLATHFVNRVNQANRRNVNLTPDALERLKDHPWPGNIRQLSNVIERIVLLADKTVLNGYDIEAILSADAPDSGRARIAQDERGTGPLPVWSSRPYAGADSHSAADLQDAVRRCGGNKSRAAQLLGLTARQLTYRWKKSGL
ncbi:MAG TPA: sigma 54-interacting transcriptional regulator [Acidocella sp.]|jgi:Nif-specific regulatory protein|uniref:sigma-54 interaction domain-containing protein n=1 Tax=Acidocella sp. TaxID=50710 RepID=UPI002B724E10|nr:sigma 54-interacting transcriptional regulator [Acidocella sp.]HVE22306.1 sigma 54-interacting transcriptional regulator [Acidocella sp.]